MNYPLLRCLPVLALLATACTAPRTFTSSGKVTPRGEFRVGGNTAFNVATETLDKAGSTLKEAAIAAARKDTVGYSGAVDRLQVAALAYVLDPVQPTADLYVRYGVTERVDAGYKYAFGSHVFDAMYQFMGPTGTPDNPGAPGIYGSIGLQYSGQNSNLPAKIGMDKLNAIFSYELSRKDILVPLVFSQSFGPEEQYGNVSWGLVYGRTFIKYGFEPSKLFVKYAGNDIRKLNPFLNRQSFSSYGGFVNAKVGFKYAYLVPALSIYYQNYGTYDFFGLQQESYKGVSIIPSLGLQVNLGYDKNSRRKRY